jgi:hypothetical protein
MRREHSITFVPQKSRDAKSAEGLRVQTVKEEHAMRVTFSDFQLFRRYLKGRIFSESAERVAGARSIV